MKKELLEQIGSELTTQQNFVATSFPSVFSKEDVMKLLDSYTQSIFAIVSGIETEAKVTLGLTLKQKDELQELIREKMHRKLDRMDSEDVVDYDSAEFEIAYGNSLRLESINFNGDTIADEIDYAIDEALTDFFEAIEEVEEEVVNETPYATEQ